MRVNTAISIVMTFQGFIQRGGRDTLEFSYSVVYYFQPFAGPHKQSNTIGYVSTLLGGVTLHTTSFPTPQQKNHL